MVVIRIGLIGDYDPGVTAHQAIPSAIAYAAAELGVPADTEWVPSDSIHTEQRIADFDALWGVPASPYRSMAGALLAIRWARESRRPYLGTCGGFQHAVIEFARNVLGWTDAEHAETAPDAPRTVISLLGCGLVEATETLRLLPGTRIRSAYGRDEIVEGYRCRYGINPAFAAQLTARTLKVAALAPSGEIRALELEDHPFFVTTLFQPERAALAQAIPPLARAFLAACR